MSFSGMNRCLRYSTLLALAMFASISDAYAQPKAAEVTATLKKVEEAKLIFRLLGYSLSADYLDNWVTGAQRTKALPRSAFQNRSDVLNEIAGHRSAFINRATENLRAGVWSPNRTYAWLKEAPMARPLLPSDFTFAVGGCQVRSDVAMQVSAMDPRTGIVVVSFTYWSASINDVYKFDASDAYTIYYRGLLVGFSNGELKAVEDAGRARRFNILSESLKVTDARITGPFTVAIPILRAPIRGR